MLKQSKEKKKKWKNKSVSYKFSLLYYKTELFVKILKFTIILNQKNAPLVLTTNQIYSNYGNHSFILCNRNHFRIVRTCSFCYFLYKYWKYISIRFSRFSAHRPWSYPTHHHPSRKKGHSLASRKLFPTKKRIFHRLFVILRPNVW